MAEKELRLRLKEWNLSTKGDKSVSIDKSLFKFKLFLNYQAGLLQ